MDQDRLRETLITVLDQALPACAQLEYRLVGTGAALLQGVDLPAAEVDLLVKTREAVEAFGAALASFRCLSAPAWPLGAFHSDSMWSLHRAHRDA